MFPVCTTQIPGGICGNNLYYNHSKNGEALSQEEAKEEKNAFTSWLNEGGCSPPGQEQTIGKYMIIGGKF